MEPTPPKQYTDAAQKMQEEYKQALARMAAYKTELLRRESLAFEQKMRMGEEDIKNQKANRAINLNNMVTGNRQTMQNIRAGQQDMKAQAQTMDWQRQMQDWARQDRPRDQAWLKQDRANMLSDRERLIALQNEQMQMARDEYAYAQKQRKRQDEYGFLAPLLSGGLGAIGTGVGAALGGPAGMALGGNIGSSLGGAIGGAATGSYAPVNVGSFTTPLASMYTQQGYNKYGSDYNPFSWEQNPNPGYKM